MEERFEYLVTDGYEFEFGKYFTEAWQLFKKATGSMIGFFLILFVIVFLGAMIAGLLTALQPVIGVIAMIGVMVVYITLLCGIFIYLRNVLSKMK